MIKDTHNFWKKKGREREGRLFCIAEFIEYFVFCRKQQVTEELHKAVATQENKILYKGIAKLERKNLN